MRKLAITSSLLLALLFSASLAAQELVHVPVDTKTVNKLYYLDGVVEAVHQSTLTAQTSGQVKALHFDVEDFVESGQVILELDDTEQQARIKQAEANLNAAAAGLKDARDEHRRVKEIFAKNLVSKSALDKTEAALKKAYANHEAALASLEQAQKQLEYTRVTAPYSGLVTERHIEVGETAQPGKPLMSGISLDRLRVVVDVPQNLINAIRKEKRAMVEIPDNGMVPVEKLTIFPFAEKRSNTFKVRLDLPEDFKGLLPGMFVKVAFVTGETTVMTVPISAVVFRSEVTAVYIVEEDGKVMFRHIRIGHLVDANSMEVLSGLLKNEQVALDPIAAGALLKKQRR